MPPCHHHRGPPVLFCATTGASSVLRGSLHQSLLEQLEAIRVIREAASPFFFFLTSARKKGVPPLATLKFPFAVLRCLARGGGEGQRGPLAHGES